MRVRGGHATILYPAESSAASDQRIEILDPFSGDGRAVVTLRPVHIEMLDHLIAAPAAVSARQASESYASYLAFGRSG